MYQFRVMLVQHLNRNYFGICSIRQTPWRWKRTETLPPSGCVGSVRPSSSFSELDKTMRKHVGPFDASTTVRQLEFVLGNCVVILNATGRVKVVFKFIRINNRHNALKNSVCRQENKGQSPLYIDIHPRWIPWKSQILHLFIKLMSSGKHLV